MHFSTILTFNQNNKQGLYTNFFLPNNMKKLTIEQIKEKRKDLVGTDFEWMFDKVPR